MKKTGLIKINRLLSSEGFTLTEMVVAIGLIAILSAVAIPSFVAWRNNLYYKQAASEITNSLKTAKNNAIKFNQPYGIQFIPAGSSYPFGNLTSYRFGKYSSATSKWVYNSWNKNSLSPTVGVNRKLVALNLNGPAASATAQGTAASATTPPPIPNISFESNGSSFDNYSVRIKDTANNSIYTISVERSGRIRMIRVK